MKYKTKEWNFSNGKSYELIFDDQETIGYFKTKEEVKKAIVSHQIDDGVKG